MKEIFILLLSLFVISCSSKSENSENIIIETESDIAQETIDSVKQVKIKNQSDSLYKAEGERIFGDFNFGMSQKDFIKRLESLNKETEGIITIKGYDFVINVEKCLFFHDKLYEMELVSTFPEYLIDFELSHDEKMERIEDSEKTLLELFKDKYGEAHDNKGWHFNHKDITVIYAPKDRFAEDMEQYRWVSIIRISKPLLKKQAEDEQKQKQQKEASAKAREDSIKNAKQNAIRKKRAEASEGI